MVRWEGFDRMGILLLDIATRTADRWRGGGKEGLILQILFRIGVRLIWAFLVLRKMLIAFSFAVG